MVSARVALVGVLAARLVGCEKEKAAATFGDGLVCQNDHREGSKPVHACWRVLMQCANGTTVTANKCGDVAPMGKSAVANRSTEPVNPEQCDSVVSSSLDSLRLSAR
jgi:hypothetical protein